MATYAKDQKCPKCGSTGSKCSCNKDQKPLDRNAARLDEEKQKYNAAQALLAPKQRMCEHCGKPIKYDADQLSSGGSPGTSMNLGG